MNFGVIMLKKFIIFYFYLKTKYFNNFKSEKDLHDWQEKKILQFLKKILKKSKYYQTKYNGLKPENWREFPLIDKHELMKNFDSLNTVNITKEDAFNIAYKAEKERDFSPKIKGITVGLSSGTSGNRGIFLASDIERYKWAGAVLAKILPKSIFCKNKIAFFLRANSNLYEAIKSKTVIFKYFDMLKPVEENLKELDAFKPSIIIAPPSMLKIIAKNYKNLNINPEKIIAVAEVLEDLDKSFMEKIFSQKIHQVYQATEGFIATTCKCENLHINEDVLAIQKEYIDKENGKFIPIITDFNRTSEPIIRYRLNDILTETDFQCPCGSKFLCIKKIEGRCDDIFMLKSKKDENLIQIFPDFISRAVIFSSPLIQEYKIIQISYDCIEIYIDAENEFEKVKNALIELFEKKHCQIPEFKIISKPENTGTKKFKRIECAINKK